MKKEKLSFLVLVVEIAAIVFLHSAKNRQTAGGMAQANKNTNSSTYQLKALPITKIK